MNRSPAEPSAEPTWPTSRDLERYCALLDVAIADRLTGHAAEAEWIEIGPGDGALPMLPLIGTPGVTLSAIGWHARRLPEGIAFTQGSVPDDLAFLARHRGTATLVTDVYSAVSYCDDPVCAMIYGALLLAEGGTFAAFTELYRFGDLATWDRITEFFRVVMGQDVRFQTTSVRGDASKRHSTCVRVHLVNASTSTLTPSELFDLARRDIGVATPGDALWKAADESAAIRRVDYVV